MTLEHVFPSKVKHLLMSAAAEVSQTQQDFGHLKGNLDIYGVQNFGCEQAKGPLTDITLPLFYFQSEPLDRDGR